MLTFNAELHEYRWNNEIVPGVTDILKTIGITRDYAGVDEFYRLRGRAVHRAIELHLKGQLDPSSIDPEHVQPYFDAFKRFQEEKKYQCHCTEVMKYSKKYNFAGTFDQTGGFYAGGVGLVDIKATEDSDKGADLQLCGYAQLFKENYGYEPIFRMVLELHGDRTYRPIYYETPPTIWASVMELYKWKKTRRVLPLAV